jgi:hypothetical protein
MGQAISIPPENASLFYDCVVKIHSLARAKEGWEIHGSKGVNMGELFAKFIAIIGDFKVGKTFVASLLQVPLPHSPTTHTNGLCLKVSPHSNRDKSEVSQQSQKVEPKPPLDLKRARKQPNVESSDRSEARVNGFCIIDSEGTDKNTSCTFSLLFDNFPALDIADQRATEFFLRTMLLFLATKFILVTNRWGFTARTKVSDLIEQIESLPNPALHLSQENRLFVIHNHAEIQDLNVLKQEIAVCIIYVGSEGKRKFP